MATLGWALAPVFIRGLSTTYDPYTMNFLRYTGAGIPLLAISLLVYRDDLRAAAANWRGMVGIALLNVFQQTLWTIGCSGAGATVAQIVSKLSVVLVIVFSFVLFHEERAVIKSPVYLLGTLASLAGVGIVIGGGAESMALALDFPMVAVLIVAVLWAVYMVWGKHLVRNVHPVPMFTVLAIYTTIGFGVLTFVAGTPSTLVSAGPRMATLALVSGLLPIGMAHPCFHFGQKYLGSAFSSSVVLLNPLLTYLVAQWFWPDERLALVQWAGAALLLGGTFAVIYVGRRVSASARFTAR